MGRVAILEAIYTRVSDMTVANGYHYNWVTLESDGNGARIGEGNAINASMGQSERLDNGSGAQNQYKMSIPVNITGIVFIGDSTVKNIHLEIEKTKAKIEEDIIKAYGIAYDALCTAGGQEIMLIEEVDNPNILLSDDSKNDAFEAELTLQYEVKYYSSWDIA